MKIIDAHMHYFNISHFKTIARKAGHTNSVKGWQKICDENNIVYAIAMGNSYDAPSRFGGVPPRLIDLGGDVSEEFDKIPDNIGYCLGVSSEDITSKNAEKTALEFEYYLKNDKKHCLGLKFYMGYNSVYLNDKRHQPLFEIAKEYKVPVAMHSGETASNRGQLKYAHPLTVDEAALEHPDVKFVICHIGNPWVQDAITVAGKNENVYIDLSGLMEGIPSKEYLAYHKDYFAHMNMWLKYANVYGKIMYGSDWPLINIPTYVDVMKKLIPVKHHEEFFYKNALKVYSRIKIPK